MKVTHTKLSGLVVIEPKVFGDARGFFLETYQQKRYAEQGVTSGFIQDNLSRSSYGVVRGLHYQLHHPQAKLVSVLRGSVLDVAVDIRRGSPTFGQAFSIELSEANHLQLFIPPGFAHGFSVLSETADFYYKCSEYYRPEDEHGVLWNDPALQLDWQVAHPVLSAKDQKYPLLKDIAVENLPVYQTQT